MKHRMYERILYDTYTKLNKGLEYIHDVQGHGCPLGMEPITLEELEYDRQSAPCDDGGYRKIISVNDLDLKEKPCIKRFLYDNREAYIKHLTSIGQWPMECNKKTVTEDRYKYLRNNIFNKH